MTELQENTVISLDEFRKRHPVPSGKLIRDPYCKSRIRQDERSKPVQRSDAQKDQRLDPKLRAALEKYGSFSGNAMKNQHKDKIKLEGGDGV